MLVEHLNSQCFGEQVGYVVWIAPARIDRRGLVLTELASEVLGDRNVKHIARLVIEASFEKKNIASMHRSGVVALMAVVEVDVLTSDDAIWWRGEAAIAAAFVAA